MSFFWEAESWVAIAFLILMAIFWKLGVPAMVTKALDDRAGRIKGELDEARVLKEEAQKVLAEAERRRRDAEKEAEGIVAGARADAERVAAEAKIKVEEFVARRTKMAEAKIAQAEQQAVADVRAAAADAAVAAAGEVLRGSVKGPTADSLISNGISQISSKLN
jgi:F-type H+-transporting ATPase subunit b